MNAQDIRNLQEAYMNVYVPQELTEEQVWEKVKNLVNYLIEEGYDLSDYTWEEMYESYIEEQGRPANRRTGGPSVQQVKDAIAAREAERAAKASQRGPTGAAARPEFQFKSTKVPSPTTSTNRSPEFRDIQRLNRIIGGPIGTRTLPNPPRAPKPAWEKPAFGPAPKPTTTKPTLTSTAKSNSYRPGATVRATGPNMNKFPQLQTFANQEIRRIAEPVSRVAGTVAALRNITPAGVATAVLAPRPTADGTLTSALKRGDYKPQQGPKNPDQGLSKAQSFDKAYKTAKNTRRMGSTFTWNNRSYKVEEYDALFSYILDEGYADNEKAATTIVENMSQKWISTILEAHPLDKEREFIQRGISFRQRTNLKPKPKNRTVGK